MVSLMTTARAGAVRGMSSPGARTVRIGSIGVGIITVTTGTMINPGPTPTKPVVVRIADQRQARTCLDVSLRLAPGKIGKRCRSLGASPADEPIGQLG